MEGFYLLILGIMMCVAILFSAYRADYEIGLIPSLYPKHYAKLSPNLRKFCIFQNKSGKTWVLKYLYADVIIAYFSLALGMLFCLSCFIFSPDPDVYFIFYMIQMGVAALQLVYFIIVTMYYKIKIRRR